MEQVNVQTIKQHIPEIIQSYEQQFEDQKIHFYAKSLLLPWDKEANLPKPEKGSWHHDFGKYGKLTLPYAHEWQRRMTYPWEEPENLKKLVQSIYMMYFAGNQGGKTVWAVTWAVMCCYGIHPLQNLTWKEFCKMVSMKVDDLLIKPKDIDDTIIHKPPMSCWIVAAEFPAESKVQGGEDTPLVKTFYEWTPRGDITFYRKDKIMMINESSFKWKTHDQETKKFAGDRIDIALFDEVPPLRVWNECKPRIMKKRGRFALAMTPDWGAAWTAEIVANEQQNPDYYIHTMSNSANPFMDLDYRTRILDSMDEEERLMRSEGKHIQFMGLVFKHFDRQANVLKPFEVSNANYNTVLVDWHPVKPIYITYLSISPRNIWYVWSESRVNDHIVDSVAQEIFAKLRLPDFNVSVKKWLIDAIASTQQVQDGKRKPKSIIDMFRDNGIRFIAAKFGKDGEWASSATEIDKKFKLRELYIDPSCVHHIRQISNWGAKRFTRGPLEGTLRDMVEEEEDDTCVNLMYAYAEGVKFIDNTFELAAEANYYNPRARPGSRIYAGARG